MEKYNDIAFGGIKKVEFVIRPTDKNKGYIDPEIQITTANRTFSSKIHGYEPFDDVDSCVFNLQEDHTDDGTQRVPLGKGIFLKHDGIHPVSIIFGPEITEPPEGNPPVFGILASWGLSTKNLGRQLKIDGGQPVKPEELHDKVEWSKLIESK